MVRNLPLNVGRDRDLSFLTTCCLFMEDKPFRHGHGNDFPAQSINHFREAFMAQRSLNKVLLLGNLGKDPEVRYTSSGRAVATFTLATSQQWRDQDGNDQERNRMA